MNYSISDYYDVGQTPCVQCLQALNDCSCTKKAQRIVRPMFRGDALIFDVQVQRAPYPGGSPIPLDITGFYMWCTVKKTFTEPDTQAVAQVTAVPTSTPTGPGAGIVFTQPTVGKAEITLPAPMTVGFPDGVVKLVYDVKVRDTSNRPFTVEAGTIPVYPNVTRTT